MTNIKTVTCFGCEAVKFGRGAVPFWTDCLFCKDFYSEAGERNFLGIIVTRLPNSALSLHFQETMLFNGFVKNIFPSCEILLRQKVPEHMTEFVLPHLDAAEDSSPLL